MPISPPHPDNPCNLPLESDHLPAKIWELLRRNTGFKKTVDRLKKLRRRLTSRSQKKQRPNQPAEQVGMGVSSTHQKIGQILANISQRNKYAFTALEWLIPHLRLRRRISPHSRARLTCDTPWNKTPDGFRQEFRSLCADLDEQAKLPLEKDSASHPPSHPQAHKVTFLGGVRFKEELPKIAAHGNVTGDQLMQAMRIDDLHANYHLFAIPKPLLHRGEAKAIARWIENQLKTGLPYKREILGNWQEWRDWLSRSLTHEYTAFYQRVEYLNRLCRAVFPNFDHSALSAPALHRAKRKRKKPKRGI